MKATRQKLYWITPENVNAVIKESSEFRKTVRGSAVGSLR